MIRPQTDEDEYLAEQRAHDARYVILTKLGEDSYRIRGQLPRAEAEVVSAALGATAEALRVAEDGLTKAQRMADAWVTIAAGNASPTQVNITVDAANAMPSQVGCGEGCGSEPVIDLRDSARRLAAWATWPDGTPLTWPQFQHQTCDPQFTPILVAPRSTQAGPTGVAGPGWQGLLHAQAAAMLTTPEVLNVGRAQRLATAKQRKALQLRDGGCVLPGCEIPASRCQTHHIKAWSQGGPTDLPNLTLLCWTHHRQVDLGLWTISPPQPGKKPQITVNARHQWRT